MLTAIIHGCSVTKELKDEAPLLQSSKVFINNEVAVDSVENIVQPKPNQRFLGIPFGLLLYQSANDSVGVNFDTWLHKNSRRKKRMKTIWSDKQIDRMRAYKTGFQQWKKRNGQAPVLSDSLSRAFNAQKLTAFFSNEGYFNTRVQTAMEVNDKKAKVRYEVQTNAPYFLDSISTSIQSPVLDSIYQANIEKNVLQPGNRFRTADFEKERNRLFELFRNAGVYPFQYNSIDFSVGIDSSGVDYRLPVQLNIRNYIENIGGTTLEKEYRIATMNNIEVYLGTSGGDVTDSYSAVGNYNGLSLFSQEKLKYNRRLLRESISFKTGEVYSDLARSTTLRQLTRLQSFDYPSIKYTYANEDETLLDAAIYLMPKERYSLQFGLDLTQSDILKRGIAFSSGLSVLNVFRSAETLELGARGSLGRSANVAISEVAWDLQLRAPQFLFPFGKRLNRQKTAPQTSFRIGSANQKNIGLDKESLSAAIEYSWKPKNNRRWTFSFVDVEFVNNKNENNYFGVYTNAYNELNTIATNTNTNPNYFANNKLIIPTGAQGFIGDVLQQQTSLTPEDAAYNRVQLIEERRSRLTQNNLIFSSGIQFFSSNKGGVFDRSFAQFRTNVSWAGNLLYALAKPLNWKQTDGQYLLFDVPFSQYIKLETDWIRHWELNGNQVMAIRAYAGAAIPFGNADNIPFNRSFFGGGAYDNRAWEVYRLGPGSSNTGNEFNEANLKLAFNMEYRFDVIGSFKGALFVDVGNIWNVADNVEEGARRFDGFRDLDELAVGSGFGVRYDFGLFLLRLDLGFKTHNPVLQKGSRWDLNYQLKNANPTIGINYPF